MKQFKATFVNKGLKNKNNTLEVSHSFDSAYTEAANWIEALNNIKQRFPNATSITVKELL